MWFALTASALLASAGTPATAAAERTDGARKISISGIRGSLQNPCWSPDGTMLAVTNWKRAYNRGKAQVLAVPSGGGAVLHPISPADAQSVNLPGSCWSKGTNEVVYSSDPSGPDQAFVAPGDGSGEPRQITKRPRVVFEPSFSADGTRIVWEDHRKSEARGELWTCAVAACDPRRLTKGHDDRQPVWSPAGEEIVFQRRTRGRGLPDLYTVRADGSALRRVTRTKSLEETDASFSPSGEWIVFSSDGDGVDLASLFTIAVDGTGRQRLTSARRTYDGAPGWSPDGTQIAFETVRGDPDRSKGTRLAVIAAPEGRR